MSDKENPKDQSTQRAIQAGLGASAVVGLFTMAASKKPGLAIGLALVSGAGAGATVKSLMKKHVDKPTRDALNTQWKNIKKPFNKKKAKGNKGKGPEPK